MPVPCFQVGQSYTRGPGTGRGEEWAAPSGGGWRGRINGHGADFEARVPGWSFPAPKRGLVSRGVGELVFRGLRGPKKGLIFRLLDTKKVFHKVFHIFRVPRARACARLCLYFLNFLNLVVCLM